MDFDSFNHLAGVVFQIFVLDLLLSGDNALIIALACRSLPSDLRRRAIMLGTVFAIGLRVILTGIVSFLLQVPLLKMLGALLLLVIAIKLLLPEKDQDGVNGLGRGGADSRLLSAVMVVVSADLAMSLDNVVALAAVAQGNIIFLVLGLLLSMPLLMYGSLLINRWLDENPLLIPAGSALLGWIAGQLAVSDPLIADWVNTQAPALSVVVPLLCAAFVLLESRIIRQQRPRVATPPPLLLMSGLSARLARLGESQSDSDQASRPEIVTSAPALKPEAAMNHDGASDEERERLALEAAHAANLRRRQAEVERATVWVDPLERSRKMALVIKVLLGLALVAGAIALGGMLITLISQGVLPTPKTPPH